MLKISANSTGMFFHILEVMPSGSGALFFGFLCPFLSNIILWISVGDTSCSSGITLVLFITLLLLVGSGEDSTPSICLHSFCGYFGVPPVNAPLIDSFCSWNCHLTCHFYSFCYPLIRFLCIPNLNIFPPCPCYEAKFYMHVVGVCTLIRNFPVFYLAN